MEIKMWVLSGVISVLILILGILYGAIKSLLKNFIFRTWPEILSRLDKIVNEIEKLNTANVIHEAEMRQLRTQIKELKERHESCVNFSKVPKHNTKENQ